MRYKPRSKPRMYEHISANLWRSRALLALMVVVLASVGYLRYHQSANTLAGLLWAVLIAVIVVYFYRHMDDLLLRITGAIPANRGEYQHYVNCVEALSIAAGLPSPEAYVIHDQAPTSFAVGRDPVHASVCVTTGLISLMSRDELESVVGHEMAHVASYDIRLSTLAAAISWTIQVVSLSTAAERIMAKTRELWLRVTLALLLVAYAASFWLTAGPHEALRALIAILILAAAVVLWGHIPGLATIGLQLSLNRHRDLLADANAVLYTRNPRALISALTKLGKSRRRLCKSHPALACLLIHNPALPSHGIRARLLATHPPMQERLRRLQEMCPPPVSARRKRETDPEH